MFNILFKFFWKVYNPVFNEQMGFKQSLGLQVVLKMEEQRFDQKQFPYTGNI